MALASSPGSLLGPHKEPGDEASYGVCLPKWRTIASNHDSPKGKSAHSKLLNTSKRVICTTGQPATTAKLSEQRLVHELVALYV